MNTYLHFESEAATIVEVVEHENYAPKGHAFQRM